MSTRLVAALGALLLVGVAGCKSRPPPVGDDLHALGKVKDFSSYVAKIRASGADSVITGNWGNDLVLLVKAAREEGLTVDWYTYYANSPGMLTALSGATLGHIRNVHVYAVNPQNERSGKYIGRVQIKRVRIIRWPIKLDNCREESVSVVMS